MLESFLAWTWITTQGEPFNIKAMVVSFPFYSLNNNTIVGSSSQNIYVHVCFGLAFLDQISRLLLDLLLVLACLIVSWLFV